MLRKSIILATTALVVSFGAQAATSSSLNITGPMTNAVQLMGAGKVTGNIKTNTSLNIGSNAGSSSGSFFTTSTRVQSNIKSNSPNGFASGGSNLTIIAKTSGSSNGNNN